MKMTIKQMIFKDQLGNIEKVEAKDIDRLFYLTSIDFKKKAVLSLIKKPKYALVILSLLFGGAIRKINKKSPAITDASYLRATKNTKSTIGKPIELTLVLDNGLPISFNTLNCHICNILGDIQGIFIKNQYNIQPEKIRDKVVLDCGAHHGVFSIYASILGAKKVYSFEPVSNTFNVLSYNIKQNELHKNIFPINMGVGEKNKEAQIFFNISSDGSASLHKEGKDFEKIKITSLDAFVKLKKIDKIGLIKMDIEGNEEEALIGANRIIKKDKPILTFSAYHKKDDKIKLPKRVLSIRSDYKIKLLKSFEEDFYCE